MPDRIGVGHGRPMPNFRLLYTGINNLLKRHQQTHGAGGNQHRDRDDARPARSNRCLADCSWRRLVFGRSPQGDDRPLSMFVVHDGAF